MSFNNDKKLSVLLCYDAHSFVLNAAKPSRSRALFQMCVAVVSQQLRSVSLLAEALKSFELTQLDINFKHNVQEQNIKNIIKRIKLKK